MVLHAHIFANHQHFLQNHQHFFQMHQIQNQNHNHNHNHNNNISIHHKKNLNHNHNLNFTNAISITTTTTTTTPKPRYPSIYALIKYYFALSVILCLISLNYIIDLNWIVTAVDNETQYHNTSESQQTHFHSIHKNIFVNTKDIDEEFIESLANQCCDDVMWMYVNVYIYVYTNLILYIFFHFLFYMKQKQSDK